MENEVLGPGGVAGILDSLARHGPATIVLFLILAVIVLYIKYIIYPTEKEERENKKTLVERQIKFIDSIESLVKLQTDKTVEIVKNLLEINGTLNKINSDNQKTCNEIQIVKEKINDLKRGSI